jgi:chemosensory pili system protein ChpA (sensor histidine kinase/response regulator)
MVVSDLKMPWMDGLSLLAWFRGQPWERKVPFVLLTSSTAQSDRDRARELGADEYLEKPGRFGDLVMTVAEILKRHGIL